MLVAGSVFLILGVLGLAWSTFAASIAGLAIATLSGKRRDALSITASPTQPLQLEVLIAAHNEESIIAQTLESIVYSARNLTSSSLSVSITVGCDHCTDNTIAVVETFAKTSPLPVRAVANNGSRGKWNVLNMLVGQSRTDWVALVDAGSIWNSELLSKISPTFANPSIIGVAPSYSPKKSGALERFNWRLEQFLKRLENQSGGPVSVHGATVLYRRDTLVTALAELTGIEWLNDDVVIPLTLRLQNPEKRIVYFSEGVATGWVSDIGVRSELGVEYRRRRRMLIGNLQWIKLILFSRWSSDLAVAAIASRRFFRMFWAYWILFVGVGAGLLSTTLIAGQLDAVSNLNLLLICSASISFAMGLFAFSDWMRRLSMAFISGLQLPRYWKEFGKNRGVVWL